jgi:hypothetical protein
MLPNPSPRNLLARSQLEGLAGFRLPACWSRCAWRDPFQIRLREASNRVTKKVRNPTRSPALGGQPYPKGLGEAIDMSLLSFFSSAV